ncbi:MAG: O-antigen ligase family protein [Anaerolineae bacterium]|nr:O-antigen ligase family protein [Anaerolineae bacterium]
MGSTPIHSRSMQQILLENDRRFSFVVTIALCVAAGLVAGAYVAILSPLYAVAGVLVIAAGLLMLRDIRWGLVALIGLITLLPFGALPFKLGFTPTFLDLVLVAIYFVWIARIARGKAGSFIGTALNLPVAVFLLLACASFIAGLGHSYLNQYVLRHFVEILLCISLFFVVVNSVRTWSSLKGLVIVLIVAGSGTAIIGIVLYFLPAEWSIRLLSTLGRLGYPTGSGVLRYVEDDPNLPLRAISTSTDPNILGGLLILITTLTVAQLFSREPLLRRPLLAGMALLDAVCLYLTYSRGSLLGLVVGLGVLAAVKYRRLIPLMMLAAMLSLLLPQAQAYIQHLVEGLQAQDLATQMRLGEYKDAFLLISRHPWIGVGFVGTPETSLYIGVSSVYLLIAEEMGLIGLAVFLFIIALFFQQVWRAWPSIAHSSQGDLREDGAVVLGLVASVAGILVGGILDHYFFNLNFPHSVAVFWLYLGLTMAALRIAGSRFPRTEIQLVAG